MDEEKSSLKSLYQTVGSWHGTGRYKHGDKDTIDILKGILAAGALTPYSDAWDPQHPGASSVSVARSRAYARLYASLFFPVQQRNLEELWRRFLWSWQYLLPSLIVMWREYGPLRSHVVDYKAKVAASTAKLSQIPQSFFYMFLWGGTDIPTNYPMLIGIQQEAYITTPGSRFVDLHEERISTAISIKNFTHIEVPFKYIEEVSRLLKDADHALTVIPLEQGDACRRF